MPPHIFRRILIENTYVFPMRTSFIIKISAVIKYSDSIMPSDVNGYIL